MYRAQQLTLEREVAVKILHPVSRGDKYIYGRFEREAQILSKLKHKHIVDVYSFGIDDGQRCYMSMQFLEGQTLAQLLLREQKLNWERAMRIASQICDALAAAHKHGIVHRDLTPRNIMLLQDPEPDFVKVLDFGLCGALPENAHSMQSLTQTGALIGTVHYMSPEVCQGNKADRRSDVYSIGCILYECLAGRPPLDADEAVSVLFMQTTQTPARLKSVRVGAKMPDDLELAVFKAMQKAPEDRFQTVEEMKAVLECIMEGKEATPCLVAVPLPDPDAETAAKKKRKTVFLAAAGAAMGTMAILLAVQIIRWNSLQLPPSDDLRSAEKLMDEGYYEKSVPIFMKVVHTKLNDQDATQVGRDKTPS